MSSLVLNSFPELSVCRMSLTQQLFKYITVFVKKYTVASNFRKLSETANLQAASHFYRPKCFEHLGKKNGDLPRNCL